MLNIQPQTPLKKCVAGALCASLYISHFYLQCHTQTSSNTGPTCSRDSLYSHFIFRLLCKGNRVQWNFLSPGQEHPAPLMLPLVMGIKFSWCAHYWWVSKASIFLNTYLLWKFTLQVHVPTSWNSWVSGDGGGSNLKSKPSQTWTLRHVNLWRIAYLDSIQMQSSIYNRRTCKQGPTAHEKQCSPDLAALGEESNQGFPGVLRSSCSGQDTDHLPCSLGSAELSLLLF